MTQPQDPYRPDPQSAPPVGYTPPAAFPQPPGAFPQPPAAYPQAADAFPPPGGYPPPPYGYAAPRPSNGLALASMITSIVTLFVCGPAAIAGAIMGHIARKQIRERGEEGEGFATAGIIVGWIGFALWTLGIIAYGILVVWIITQADHSTSSSYN